MPMDNKREFKNIIEIREYIRWKLIKAIIRSKVLEDNDLVIDKKIGMIDENKTLEIHSNNMSVDSLSIDNNIEDIYRENSKLE